jgi:hypothetical protein
MMPLLEPVELDPRELPRELPDPADELPPRPAEELPALRRPAIEPPDRAALLGLALFASDAFFLLLVVGRLDDWA